MVDEWKTNLMSLAILFHLLCAQHVSDINISIFRSLRLCCWITTSVVLFSVRCVLELLLRLVFGGVRFAGRDKSFFSTPATSRPVLDPPNLVLMGYRISFRVVKQPGPDAVLLPSSRTDVNNFWSCNSTATIRLYGMNKYNIALYSIRCMA